MVENLRDELWVDSLEGGGREMNHGERIWRELQETAGHECLSCIGLRTYVVG